MKALIFNSGVGRRLGKLTEGKPKSMIRLGNGESLFGRQIRLLYTCGVREFVVTTGPMGDQLQSAAQHYIKKGCTFTFVKNELYSETNYIYSMFLAQKYLDDDLILLHGDLVFDGSYLQEVIDSPIESLGSVNSSLPLPKKDFKARVCKNFIEEVSVNIFDEDCVAFQPLYKLGRCSARIWIDAVNYSISQGDTDVYAENAANRVFKDMKVQAYSYVDHVLEEIDTPEDLTRVSEMIRGKDFEDQPIFISNAGRLTLQSGSAIGELKEADSLADILNSFMVKRIMVISGSHFGDYPIKKELKDSRISYTVFSSFSSNPTYDEIVQGVEAYKVEKCDALISVGGGSAIDLAKCVKLFLIEENDAPPLLHIAIPTTAGTGSESTHFAVYYKEGEKQSATHDALLPDIAVLDIRYLRSLSLYQKKCTFLDALCQSIESYWSKGANAKSRQYSERAIKGLLNNCSEYFNGDETAAEQILIAANYAGKAINLTTTTAAHAMSYKLTSLYGLPHGHAVALCMPFVWENLLNRHDESLNQILQEISVLMGSETGDKEDGLRTFRLIMETLDIAIKVQGGGEGIPLLVSSVNKQRLANHPVVLTQEEIRNIYKQILSE